MDKLTLRPGLTSLTGELKMPRARTMPAPSPPVQPFTARDKLACAERELRYRRNFYPRAVANRRMTEAEAQRELALMAAIADDYRRELGPARELAPAGDRGPGDLITQRYRAEDS